MNPKKPDKIRVLFDCAAKFMGVSLNDKLLQGPDLLSRLSGVLTRFRLKPIALVADIEVMFHQVKVSPEDRSALQFLWWPDGDVDKRPEVYSRASQTFFFCDPVLKNIILRDPIMCTSTLITLKRYLPLRITW